MSSGYTVVVALAFPGAAGLPVEIAARLEPHGVAFLGGPSVSPVPGVKHVILAQDPERTEVIAVVEFLAEAIPQKDQIEPLRRAQGLIGYLVDGGLLPPSTRVVDIIAAGWDGAGLNLPDRSAVAWTRKGGQAPSLWGDLYLYTIGTQAANRLEWFRVMRLFGLPPNRILWRKAYDVVGVRLEYSESHAILRAPNADKLLTLQGPPEDWVSELDRKKRCLVVSSVEPVPVQERSSWLKRAAQEERVVGGMVPAVRSEVPPDLSSLPGCTFIPATHYDPELRRQIYLDSNVLIDIERWFYRDSLNRRARTHLKDLLLAICGDDIVPGLAIEETCRSRAAEGPNLGRISRAGYASLIVSHWLPEQIEAEFALDGPAADRYPAPSSQAARDRADDVRSRGGIYDLQVAGYATLLKLRLLMRSRFSGPEDRISRFRRLLQWIDGELRIGTSLELKVALNACFGCAGDPEYVQRLMKFDAPDPVHATWTAMWDLTFLRFLEHRGSIDAATFNPGLVTRDRALASLRATCHPAPSTDPPNLAALPYLTMTDVSPRWQSLLPQIIELLEQHAGNQLSRMSPEANFQNDDDSIERARDLALALETEFDD